MNTETAGALRDVQILDAHTARLVYRAGGTEAGTIVLEGNQDDFDELLDSVASEANHEGDPRRQKRLDDAFQRLSRALDALPR